MVTALTLKTLHFNLIVIHDYVENKEIASARQYYLETKDAASAVAKMPKWRSVEKNLLQGLAKHADTANLLGALNFVSILIMY